MNFRLTRKSSFPGCEAAPPVPEQGEYAVLAEPPAQCILCQIAYKKEPTFDKHRVVWIVVCFYFYS